MGEIAEMMLEGTLCQHCGEYLDEDAPGYPRSCASCSIADNIRKVEDEHFLQQVDEHMEPKRCPLCGKKCKDEYGIHQHMRDKHKTLGKLLVFKLVPTDDEHLTCFFCGKQKVDHEFTYRKDNSSGARKFITEGVHQDCIPQMLGNPLEHSTKKTKQLG